MKISNKEYIYWEEEIKREKLAEDTIDIMQANKNLTYAEAKEFCVLCNECNIN